MNCLHTLSASSDFPDKFTYPFEYTPHPLCIQAAGEVIKYLQASIPELEHHHGKMFGVMIVSTGKEESGEVNFVTAFSGTLNWGVDESFFVPSVYTLPPHSIPNTPEESKQLQDYIYSQYNMLNAEGETRNLLDIFFETPLKYPPSGSGDCCAPKMLQYVFQNGWQPICMAEFWIGLTPKGEIRHHMSYYPSCQGRCKPILSWMLKGLEVDDDPMNADNSRLTEELKVVYEDEWLIIVNKPSGMLSVPGKVHAPCVTDIIQDVYPVHRLDMHTSGLQILVRHAQTQKDLQHLFADRQVKKRYRALLEGIVENDSGTISLPLSSDYLNRPRQCIDYEHGKKAITEFRVVSRTDGRTLVDLFPHTGRTHQLRVHCASEEGLGCPIVGDNLYGIPCSTPTPLQLQAQMLEFIHPITQKQIHIEIE